MKRTFPANINGKVYNIDEDAYNLLQNYFTQLRDSFPGNEGVEISADIEARVGEIFDEKLDGGPRVITIYDVNDVIERMGRPEQLSDDENRSRTSDSDDGPDQPLISINSRGKRLYRDTRNAVLGGVISGLAEFTGWNCNIMRLFMVLIVLFSFLLPVSVIPVFIVYLIAWMVIPPASNSRRILEMQGRPVTVDGVGRTVLDGSTATPPPYAPQQYESDDSFTRLLGRFMRLLGKCALVFVFVFASLVLLGAMVFLMVVAAGMVLGFCYDNMELMYRLTNAHTVSVATYRLLFSLFLCFAIIVPSIGIMCGTGGTLFKRRCNSVALTVTLIVLEVLFIAACVVTGNFAF